MLNIGYIGLGIMGKSMAKNILRAGFPLWVHNRSNAAVEEMVSLGAIAARTPREVADLTDVVFTNLPDSPDVEKVTLGPQGIIEASRPGLIVVDNSTIKPGVSRKIAAELLKKGMFAIDAPVSGGDVGAKNGTLAIMAGGSAEALQKIMPVLMAVGKTVTHVGGPGAGQVAKAANQIMVAAQMAALGELLVFARKSGVDPEKVIAAIKSGAAQCWAIDTKPQRLFKGERGPGFKAYMQLKDLRIVIETAREYHIPLPAAEVHADYFKRMVELGMGELDNSAVVGVVEKAAGADILKGET